eukprot:scaffold554811_cov34-Prasinocladus_malaysianus.AAC.1
MMRGRDLMVGYVVGENYMARAHKDDDAAPTAVGVFDIGLCENCNIQQQLVFPKLSSSLPLIHGSVTVFDPTEPHCASAIKKSNPGCPCPGKRISVVVHVGARYVVREIPFDS